MASQSNYSSSDVEDRFPNDSVFAAEKEENALIDAFFKVHERVPLWKAEESESAFFRQYKFYNIFYKQKIDDLQKKVTDLTEENQSLKRQLEKVRSVDDISVGNITEDDDDDMSDEKEDILAGKTLTRQLGY